MASWTSLGSAKSPDEQDLERALRWFAGVGAGARYRRVDQGITNINWIVESEGGRFFVKIYGRGTETFIDRTTAIEASRLAGDLGVGPRLRAVSNHPGAEIYEFLDDYRNCTADDYKKSGFLPKLLAAYRCVHEAPLLSQTRDAFEQLDHRLSLIDSVGAPVPEDLESLVRQCRRAETVIRSIGIIPSPCHNDSYAPNFMINADGDVRIVDWEYASNNDPMWDLAMIVYTNLDDTIIDEVVQEYSGRPSRSVTARIQLYGGVVYVSWGLWALHQASISTISFDYKQYAEWLFNLARGVMAASAWELALVDVGTIE